MRELYEKIKKGTDRRASLIALKKELKDEAKKKVFLTMTGNRLDEIMKCLVDEDPKVRKNAAADSWRITLSGCVGCADGCL